MTLEEVKVEDVSSDISLLFKATTINKLTDSSLSFKSKFLVHDLIKPNLNYDIGASSFFTDSLVHHEDLMKVKACIEQE